MYQKLNGIEKGRALIEKEIDYVVALIMGWIERRVEVKGEISWVRKIF